MDVQLVLARPLLTGPEELVDAAPLLRPKDDATAIFMVRQRWQIQLGEAIDIRAEVAVVPAPQLVRQRLLAKDTGLAKEGLMAA